MNGYYVSITSIVSGYDFDTYVEAVTEEQAKELAINETKEMLYKILNTLKVTHIEE